MGRYIVNRMLIAIPVLIGITVFNFLFNHVSPGDPIEMMIPRDPTNMAGGAEYTDEWKASMRQRLGLDKPLPIQYILWLNELVHGNLGNDIVTDKPVAPEMLY